MSHDEYHNDTFLKSYPCEVISIDDSHGGTVLLKTEDNLPFRLPTVIFEDYIVKEKKRFIYSIKVRPDKTRYHHIAPDPEFLDFNNKVDKKTGNWITRLIKLLTGYSV